jgi:hypothetical protein
MRLVPFWKTLQRVCLGLFATKDEARSHHLRTRKWLSPGTESASALLTDIQSPELWKGISVVYKLVHELGTSDSDL